jgi:Ser/Thr protein kinase RdoA (MazF antagonist)
MTSINLEVQSTSHEGGLAATYIGMQHTEALEHLRRQFSLDGRLTRLATEKDDTFRAECVDGRKYILKIANPSEDAAEISLQVELLQHIEAADPDLPVPRLIPNRDGQVQFQIRDAAGQLRQTRLMSYLDGIPLDSTHSSAIERERIGTILGRLRHATESFSHPADLRVLAWDVTHLATLAPLLSHVEDNAYRAKLGAALKRFVSLEPQMKTLRRQVLHNDFSKSNIVVEHGRSEFVTGVIDFGDAVRTAIAIDVSTALLNQLPRHVSQQRDEDIFAHGRDVLNGYLRVADLSEHELSLIPHLTMGRVVARALITLWRARLFPQNKTYILRNTEQGWAQLDWFLQRSVNAVSETLLSSAR